jgi:hypothetical protein
VSAANPVPPAEQQSTRIAVKKWNFFMLFSPFFECDFDCADDMVCPSNII